MLSIAIPAYNCEDTIEYVINDVFQICNLGEHAIDFELLIANDGSTDNTLEKLYKIKENLALKIKDIDSKFRIITQQNFGVQAARNNLISVQRGDYIYFQDSDDRIVCKNLVKLYKAAVKEEADIAFANYIQFDTRSMQFKKPWQIEEGLKVYTGEDIKKCIHFQCIPPNRIYRKQFIVDNDIRFPTLKIGEDAYVHYVTVAQQRKIISLGENIYVYVLADGSASNTYDSRIKQIIIQFDQCEEFYKTHGYEGFLKELTDDRYYWYDGWMHKLLRYKDKELREQLFDLFSDSYMKKKTETGLSSQCIESKIKNQWFYKQQVTQTIFRGLRNVKLEAQTRCRGNGTKVTAVIDNFITHSCGS